MGEIQKMLMGKAERLYRKFIDSNGSLVNPTSPHIDIYSPTGTLVDSGSPMEESTGVYYYNFSLTTASATEEGTYQAYWEGSISGALVTMDTPQYLYVTRIPWQITEPDNMINSVRRMIGDTDPQHYRISTEDLYYYLSDAVDEVQAEYNFGYTMTIANTSYSWNKTLYATPFVLFKLRTLMLVAESTLMDNLYDGGNVQVGDIKIDVTGILRLKVSNLKRLKEDYKELMYSVKINGAGGHVIDTYKTGLIVNTYAGDYLVYE